MKKTFLIITALCLSSSLLAQTWNKDLEKKAKKGDVTAQYEVGLSYLNGNGTNKNPQKASKWFYEATQQGHKEAKSQLLSYYSKDLEKLAKEGDMEAQFQTGNCYYAGKGVDKNLEKAASWYDLAAKQGHKEAKEKFTSFYSKLLNKAAKEGDANMQFALAMCYFNGQGIAIDKEEAAVWFEKAMDQNHDKAREMFYSYDSKRKRKICKTCIIAPYMQYTGSVTGNLWKGYQMKDSPCEIIFGNVNGANTITPSIDKDIIVSGNKVGNKISSAIVVWPAKGLAFKGDATLENNTGGHKLILLAGGVFGDSQQYFKVEKDIIIDISLDMHNKVSYAYQLPVTKPTPKDFTYTDTKQIKAIISSDKRFDYVNEICTIDTISGKMTKSIGLDNNGEITIASNYGDSIYIGKGNNLFMENEKLKLVDAKGNSILWNSNNIISRFSKAYKDCFVTFVPGKNAQLIFNNGDSYVGTCSIGKMNIQGYPIFCESSKPDECMKEMLHSIWDASRLADLEFCIWEGTYTHEFGKAVQWKIGFSEEQLNMVQKAATANQARTRALEIKKQKQHTLKVKKQLLSEGFNAKDVSQLIDHCNIYNGMSSHLVERAIALQSNVKRKMIINPDLKHKISIIEIYNMNTGKRDFFQVVQYNWFTDRVCYVGPDIP